MRKQSSSIAVQPFTPKNRMLVHGDIHNGHREELQKVTAADRGGNESFLESSLPQRRQQRIS